MADDLLQSRDKYQVIIKIELAKFKWEELHNVMNKFPGKSVWLVKNFEVVEEVFTPTVKNQ